mmetsp:Transcript_90505/g.251581  ORF Transcript_90505/g.251581 Transcript_90505/m.251581 type:complete len:361 (-) Transcript_90505:414-1496(-)
MALWTKGNLSLLHSASQAHLHLECTPAAKILKDSRPQCQGRPTTAEEVDGLGRLKLRGDRQGQRTPEGGCRGALQQGLPVCHRDCGHQWQTAVPAAQALAHPSLQLRRQVCACCTARCRSAAKLQRKFYWHLAHNCTELLDDNALQDHVGQGADARARDGDRHVSVAPTLDLAQRRVAMAPAQQPARLHNPLHPPLPTEHDVGFSCGPVVAAYDPRCCHKPACIEQLEVHFHGTAQEVWQRCRQSPIRTGPRINQLSQASGRQRHKSRCVVLALSRQCPLQCRGCGPEQSWSAQHGLEKRSRISTSPACHQCLCKRCPIPTLSGVWQCIRQGKDVSIVIFVWRRPDIVDQCAEHLGSCAT